MKKSIVFALAAILTLSLASCGTKSNQTPSSTVPNPSSQTETSPSAPVTSSSSAAVSSAPAVSSAVDATALTAAQEAVAKAQEKADKIKADFDESVTKYQADKTDANRTAASDLNDQNKAAQAELQAAKEALENLQGGAGTSAASSSAATEDYSKLGKDELSKLVTELEQKKEDAKTKASNDRSEENINAYYAARDAHDAAKAELEKR